MYIMDGIEVPLHNMPQAIQILYFNSASLTDQFKINVEVVNICGHETDQVKHELFTKC